MQKFPFICMNLCLQRIFAIPNSLGLNGKQGSESAFQVMFLAFVVFGVWGCTLESNTYVQNHGDMIDEKIKLEIDEITANLFEKFKQGDIANAGEFFFEKNANSEIFAGIAEYSKEMNIDDFKVINEYHLSKALTSNKIKIKPNNDYTIQFAPISSEIFIRIGYFEDSIEEIGLIFIWAKKDNTWKLDVFKYGTYSFNKEKALNWRDKAEILFEKNEIFDSYFAALFAINSSSPGGAFWNLNSSIEMEASFEKIDKAFKEKVLEPLPITLNGIDSKPKIIGVAFSKNEYGYCPLIEVLTQYKLDDKSKIDVELDIIHEKYIHSTFFGIKNNNKVLLYNVYDSFPKKDANLQVDFLQYSKSD